MSVAIVVPTNKSALTSDEQISLAHLRHFLGGYDKYLVLPKSVELHLPDFQIKNFDDKYFGSPIAKIMPSDGCKGDTIPLAVEKWYDFHEFGCHLGNVG